MRLLLLILALSSLYTNSYAGITVAEYWDIESTSEIKEYLKGVGVGYQFANAYMERIHKVKPLFCAPADLKFNADYYKQMLDSELRLGYNTASPIEAKLLQSLIRNFPCK